MIRYVLIKMVSTGLYGKAIDCLKNLPAVDQNKWVKFRAFSIAEYGRMFREGQGPTNSQEGYVGMFNDMEGDDGESTVEDITQYLERENSAESKMSKVEINLSQLKMVVQNLDVAYIAP